MSLATHYIPVVLKQGLRPTAISLTQVKQMDGFFQSWMFNSKIQTASRTIRRLSLRPATTAQQRDLSSCLLSNAPNAFASQRKGTNSSRYATNFLLKYAYNGSKHIKQKHDRPYECAHHGCGQTFGLRTHLERQQATHTGKKEFECANAWCKTQFTREDDLKRHTKGCVAST